MTRLTSAYLFCLLLYLRLTTINCDDATPVTLMATVSSPTSSDTEASTVTTKVTTQPPKHLIGKRSFTWNEKNSDNSIIFEVDPGYFISATVSGVEFSNGNYLLIQGGNQRTEGATDGRVFANKVKGPISYLFKTNSVYGFVEKNVKDGDNDVVAKFNVKFERVGEGTTTQSSTISTTTIEVPSTVTTDSVYVTVNIKGRNYLEYGDDKVVEAFRYCVTNIATRYCQINNFNLTRDITSTYVQISEITQCPYNWPDSSTCAQITFKLPIFYDSTKWDGYQLNTTHLEAMWSQKDDLDINNTCSNMYSFDDYDDPNFAIAVTWWAIGISIVIVVLVAVLWFLRICSSRARTAMNRRLNRRRNSDTVSIMSNKKESVSSLTPHYLSDHLDTSTPKIFDI